MRRARCSGCRRSRSTSSARPTTIPACGPPSSLSPLKHDEVCARGERRRVPSARPRGRTSAPEPRSSSSGTPSRRATAASSFSVGCSVNPTTRKFDWCTRSTSAVRSFDCAFVVGRARAVRRADLDEPRARAREHVGDAEAVADLDQLAARDEHLAAFGERGEREQHRRRVVVDDECAPRRRSAGAGSPRRDPAASHAAPSARSYSRFE